MSAGLTGVSALAQGVGQYEEGEERSNLYKVNAGIAQKQAASEIAAGNYNANAIRMRGDALIGQQVAQTGGNNLQQAGTPAQVASSTRQISEMDALQTMNNARRRAWGFQVQGGSDRLQAGFAANSGLNRGLDTILAGAGKAYGEEKATGSWF